MQYFIDSANIPAIDAICRSFPITGVTTNPSIICKEKDDLKKILTGIRNVITQKRLLQVQAVAKTAEGMDAAISTRLPMETLPAASPS